MSEFLGYFKFQLKIMVSIVACLGSLQLIRSVPPLLYSRHITTNIFILTANDIAHDECGNPPVK